jgi:hypothetical protein
MPIMGILDRKLFSLLVLIADVVMFVTGAVEFRFLNVLLAALAIFFVPIPLAAIYRACCS